MTNAPSNAGPPAPSCGSCGPWWRLPLLLALVLAALVLARAVGDSGPEVVPANPPQSTPDTQANLPPTSRTVTLLVDYGAGRTREYDKVAWHDGMTAEQLAAAIQALDYGVNFTQQGTGPSALLMAIDEVKNQGGDGRNWMFYVNGRLADRGFGAYVLEPGDCVLWKFSLAQ